MVRLRSQLLLSALALLSLAGCPKASPALLTPPDFQEAAVTVTVDKAAFASVSTLSFLWYGVPGTLVLETSGDEVRTCFLLQGWPPFCKEVPVQLRQEGRLRELAAESVEGSGA